MKAFAASSDLILKPSEYRFVSETTLCHVGWAVSWQHHNMASSCAGTKLPERTETQARLSCSLPGCGRGEKLRSCRSSGSCGHLSSHSTHFCRPGRREPERRIQFGVRLQTFARVVYSVGCKYHNITTPTEAVEAIRVPDAETTRRVEKLSAQVCREPELIKTRLQVGSELVLSDLLVESPLQVGQAAREI